MQQTSKLWILSPPNVSKNMRPYGNVADISHWLDWRRGQESLPIRLFVGRLDSSWESSILTLEQWNDFIWSDDNLPWITKSGAMMLMTSRLTGFDLQETLIVEMNNTFVNDELSKEIPILYRINTTDEAIVGQYIPDTDFFLSHTRGLQLSITDRTLIWLRSNGWSNFYVEPLK